MTEALQQWADALELANPFKDFFRWLGWLLIKGVSTLSDAVYGAVEKIYSLMDFVNAKIVTDLLGDYAPLVKVLLVVSVTFFGFWLLFKKSDASMNVSQNLCLILLLIVCMPTFMSKMFALTEAGVDFAQAQYSDQKSISYTVVRDNTIDLLKVDKEIGEAEGFSKSYNTVISDIREYNNIDSSKDMKLMDVNDTINFKDDDLTSKVFDNKLVADGDGKENVEPLDQGFFTLIDEEYYRYDINWWTIILTNIALIIALIFAGFKTAKIIFEIGWNEVLAPFFAATDLASGQRIKEVIRHIISLLACLFLIAAMLGLYLSSVSFLSSKKDDIGVIAYLIALIAVTWLLIDGPNLIERILGVDAGIRSGYGMLAGAASATIAARNLGKGSKNLVRSAVNMPNNVRNMGKSVAGNIRKASDRWNTAKADAKNLGDWYEKNQKGDKTPPPKTAAELKNQGKTNVDNKKETPKDISGRGFDSSNVNNVNSSNIPASQGSGLENDRTPISDNPNVLGDVSRQDVTSTVESNNNVDREISRNSRYNSLKPNNLDVATAGKKTAPPVSRENLRRESPIRRNANQMKKPSQVKKSTSNVKKPKRINNPKTNNLPKKK